MPSNYLVVKRPATRFFNRGKTEDLQAAVDGAFTVMKELVGVEPDFGRISGPDGTPISQLGSPPEKWIKWFKRDSLVVSFNAKARPERIVLWSPGSPGRTSAKLDIVSEPDLLNDPVWLRKMLAAAVPIWDAHEGQITVWKDDADVPWLYWLKEGREPEGYGRYPMPAGWSQQSDLHDGVLYEWPENRPNGD